MNYLQLDLFLAACGFLLLYLYRKHRRSRPPLPPGPKPLPLIGNLLDFPKDRAWETYGRWANDYGDIVHVRAFGTSTIIVNTFKAACDLFDKRSSIYSDRPRLAMVYDLLDFGGSSFEPYGRIWRKHRTRYHKQLNQTAAREFQPRQTASARRLLLLILDSPQDYYQHIRYLAADVVMSIAYGHDIAPKDDPFVTMAEGVAMVFSRSVGPSAFLVNSIPMLKYVPEWMPGAGFQIFGREGRKIVADSRDVPFADVKMRMAAGTAQPSFVANALSELGTVDESEEDVEVTKRVAGSIYGETFYMYQTISSIHSFILAMVLHPVVQKKAQAELDAVIGRDRLPQFSDRDQLPYVSAVVKEVFRWHPVAPAALPHATIEDDVYEGYYIPKGSTVIGNTWAIMHDPEMYPDPWTFLPERFLPDEDGNIARDPAITGVFGFGRRICAGRHLADSSVWIAVVSLLSAFDIGPAINEQGRAIDVRYALRPPPGFFIHVDPFPCSIKPRTGEAEALIRGTEIEVCNV